MKTTHTKQGGKLPVQSSAADLRTDTMTTSKAKDGGILQLPNGLTYEYKNLSELAAIGPLVEPFEKENLLKLKESGKVKFAGVARGQALEWTSLLLEITAEESKILDDSQRTQIREALKETINEYAHETFLNGDKLYQSLTAKKAELSIIEKSKIFLDEKSSLSADLVINAEIEAKLNKIADEKLAEKIAVGDFPTISRINDELDKLSKNLNGKVMFLMDNWHVDTSQTGAGKHHIQFHVHKYPMDLVNKDCGGSSDQSLELHKSSSVDVFCKMWAKKIDNLKLGMDFFTETDQVNTPQSTENEIKTKMLASQRAENISENLAVIEEETQDIDVEKSQQDAKNETVAKFTPDLHKIIEGKEKALIEINEIDKQIRELTLKKEVGVKYVESAFHAEEAIQQFKSVTLERDEIANNLKNASVEIEKLEAEKGIYEKQNSDLYAKNEDLKGQISDKDFEIADKDIEILDLSKSNEILTDENAKISGQAEIFSAALSELNNDHNLIIDKNKVLESEKTGLTHDLNQKDAELNQKIAEFDEAIGVLNDTESNLKRTENLKSKAERELFDEKVKSGVLQSEKTGLTDQIDTLKTEKSEVEAAKKALDEKLKEVDQEKSRIERSLQKEIERLRAELDNVRSEKKYTDQSKNDQIDSLKTEINTVKVEKNKEIDTLKVEKSAEIEKLEAKHEKALNVMREDFTKQIEALLKREPEKSQVDELFEQSVLDEIEVLKKTTKDKNKDNDNEK